MRILLALLAMSSRGVLGFAPLTQPPRPLTPSQSLVPLFMAADEIEEIYMDTEDRMSKSIESVKKNLNTIRTGRANPNMLDRVTCDYYGVPTPLNQMSSISVPSSQQLQISPFDKSQLTNIQKAIVEGSLALCLQACVYYDNWFTSTGEEKESNFLKLELLTPIVKSYPAEMSILTTSAALQCFGGYGYTKDYLAELFY